MPYSTVDPANNVEIRVGKEGPAARPPTTMVALVKKTAKENADRTAMRVKRNGDWVSYTWAQYLEEAYKVAKALVALGVKEAVLQI